MKKTLLDAGEVNELFLSGREVLQMSLQSEPLSTRIG